jgi:hypothetical protein
MNGLAELGLFCQEVELATASAFCILKTVSGRIFQNMTGNVFP